MKGFSIRYNRYQNLTPEQVNRDQFLPDVTEEEYNDLGKRHAIKMYEGYLRNVWVKDIKISRVLEYGCGDGRVLRPMSEFANHITGLDICEAIVDSAREKLKDLYNVSVYKVSDYSYECSEDFIYSLQVLQHNTYEDQLLILDNINRLLVEKGIACIHLPKLEDKPGYINHDTCMCFTREQVENFGKRFGSYIIEEMPIMGNWTDYFLWVNKRM